MAFATSNVRKDVWGKMKVMYGKWTATQGDAQGTIALKGGVVHQARFETNLSSGPLQKEIPSWWTLSAGTLTVTVAPQGETVTNGRFVICYN